MADLFKIGTFNLYNFVLPGVTYYDRNRYSEAVYTKKVAWIGTQLSRMRADVVGFQELFHTEAIKTVISSIEAYQDATLIADDRHDEKGQPLPTCALLSRLPVIESSMMTNFPTAAQVNYGDQTVPITAFSRPVVRAKLRLENDIELYVFVAHLKSKRPMIDDDEDRKDPLVQAMGKARSLIRRAAETIALRHVIVDVMRETQIPVVVMGDMNDSVTAVTSDILAGSPPWRFLPFEQKQAIWDVLLYNVKDIQAKRSYHDVYYTHIYNGHYEALDHIYVSEEFIYENRDRIAAVKAVRVYNDHLADDSLGGEDVEKWQSDHGQVVAEIKLEEPDEPGEG